MGPCDSPVGDNRAYAMTDITVHPECTADSQNGEGLYYLIPADCRACRWVAVHESEVTPCG